MPIKVTKGNRVNLTKDTGLKKAMLGLGWDITGKDKEDADLDLVMFMCDRNYRCLGDPYVIFYNQLTDPEEAILHSGDNKQGSGEDDAETAFLDFSKISEKVEKIVIAVTIYEARKKRQNFGLVDNAYIRIVDAEKEEEILRYNLSEDFSIQTAVVFGEIYRHNGFWKFKAVGEGYNEEMAGLCDKYGVEYI